MKFKDGIEAFHAIQLLKQVSHVINKVYYLFDNAGVTKLDDAAIEIALKEIFDDYKGVSDTEINAVLITRSLMEKLGFIEERKKRVRRTK